MSQGHQLCDHDKQNSQVSGKELGLLIGTSPIPSSLLTNHDLFKTTVELVKGGYCGIRGQENRSATRLKDWSR
jgi:hypothetical protein